MSDDRSGVGAVWRALLLPTLLRTCTQCGSEWRVPRYFARSHPKGLPIARGNLRGGGRNVKRSNEANIGQVAAFSVCPKCQSKKHTQRRIWRLSKAEYEGLG